ncbi:MAG: hypothetical protein KAR01_14280 [Desulfocapsa sp.]|nr:hypothetical protein [Desulfocapsa sp.]
MIEVKLIRDLQKTKGKSYRKISKLTGYNFRTVKKYAEMTDFSEKPITKKARVSKLSFYTSEIDKWLTEDQKQPKKQWHTARRIHARLQEIHGDTYTVSYSLV